MVLVIMGMAVAVISPRLQNAYEAVARSGERADVVRQLQRLPLVARDRDGIDLPAGSTELAKMLKLPDGWSVVPEQPLRIESSGLCHAGIVAVHHDGDVAPQRVTLAEPDCQVSDAR
ncbi:MAG: hypothetical protein JSS25_11640 [Proteobacteria bacterium]|nr:hypothetical protein [Pseudomonadota bacterium]